MKDLRAILLLAPLSLAVAAFLGGRSVAEEKAPAAPPLPEFNRLVLDVIKSYPTDGTHEYWWPRGEGKTYSGSTQDLFLQGTRVMEGEPKHRTYCCGLTLEVFLRSYVKWLETRGGEKASALVPSDWARFQKLWFVESQNGPGPSAALVAFGVGKEIPAAEALPGDFVQIWRTKNDRGKISGHSVIFLGWVRNAENDPIGFRYWSTQPGTKGISERVEYYGPLGGLSTEYTYFARVEPKTAAAKDASGS